MYLTSHNPRLFFNIPEQVKTLFRHIFYDIDYLIVVGAHILDHYQGNGVVLPSKVLVKNAFFPPPLGEESAIELSYDSTTMKFVGDRSPIVIANASRVAFHNNQDLYGLDLCVELTARLKQAFPNIGFLFALADETGHIDYVEKIKARIRELDITENFHFMVGQKELWPLFKKADLMVRPTNTDGDGISIHEAIYFHCPAIASDVCERAKGTTLFKNRDIDDLEKKARLALQEGGARQQQPVYGEDRLLSCR